MTKEQCEERIRCLEEEIKRLHNFTLKLADHLFLAAEVLSIKAEKKSTEKKVSHDRPEAISGSAALIAWARRVPKLKE